MAADVAFQRAKQDDEDLRNRYSAATNNKERKEIREAWNREFRADKAVSIKEETNFELNVHLSPLASLTLSHPCL